MKDEQKQILKLAAEIASTDLSELVEGHRRRLFILDSQIEALRQEREALTEERHKLRAEREQLHALYQVNLRVLNIVNRPEKTGENNETNFVTRFTQ
jgi:regulator of replication initiation timing